MIVKLATKHLSTKQCFDSKFSEENQESNFRLVSTHWRTFSLKNNWGSGKLGYAWIWNFLPQLRWTLTQKQRPKIAGLVLRFFWALLKTPFSQMLYNFLTRKTRGFRRKGLKCSSHACLIMHSLAVGQMLVQKLSWLTMARRRRMPLRPLGPCVSCCFASSTCMVA